MACETHRVWPTKTGPPEAPFSIRVLACVKCGAMQAVDNLTERQAQWLEQRNELNEKEHHGR